MTSSQFVSVREGSRSDSQRESSTNTVDNWASCDVASLAPAEPIVEHSRTQCLTAGSYGGVIWGVWDVGVQPTRFEDSRPARELVISIEVDQRIPEGPLSGRRYVLSRRYKASLNDKANLMRLITSLYGKDPCGRDQYGNRVFAPVKLTGMPCLLTVTNEMRGGELRADIDTITMLPRGMTPIKPESNPGDVPKWVIELAGKRLDPPAAATRSEHTSPQVAGPTTKSKSAGDAVAPDQGDNREEE